MPTTVYIGRFGQIFGNLTEKPIHQPGCERNINNTLSELYGVNKVTADKSGKVYVEYDLMKVNLETIENSISELNYTISPGFLNKLKKGMIHFTEQNEYDNMHAEPHSCCTVPEKPIKLKD